MNSMENIDKFKPIEVLRLLKKLFSFPIFKVVEFMALDFRGLVKN
jgi:hypothetical protein